jgi:hypothetical protein
MLASILPHYSSGETHIFFSLASFHPCGPLCTSGYDQGSEELTVGHLFPESSPQCGSKWSPERQSGLLPHSEKGSSH